MTNKFIYPSKRLLARLIDNIVNNANILAIRRSILSKLPFVKLESDVCDVVYLNWVVPVELVTPYVPDGVSITTRDGKTIFTILTYKHGHFGPKGFLRKVCPSPLQSNWRLYVDQINDRQTDCATVLFVKNIFNSAIHAIGSRLMSDALPSHLADKFTLERGGERYRVDVQGGTGSSPSFSSETITTNDKSLPSEFSLFYDSWDEAIVSLCLQDAAIVQAEDVSRLAIAHIDLSIDPASVMPLESIGFTAGSFLSNIGATSKPFCFCVPKVKFNVLSEKLL